MYRPCRGGDHAHSELCGEVITPLLIYGAQAIGLVVMYAISQLSDRWGRRPVVVVGIVLQVVSIVILILPFDIEATLAFTVTSVAAQVAWLIGFVIISELYIWKDHRIRAQVVLLFALQVSGLTVYGIDWLYRYAFSIQYRYRFWFITSLQVVYIFLCTLFIVLLFLFDVRSYLWKLKKAETKRYEVSSEMSQEMAASDLNYDTPSRTNRNFMVSLIWFMMGLELAVTAIVERDIFRTFFRANLDNVPPLTTVYDLIAFPIAYILLISFNTRNLIIKCSVISAICLFLCLVITLVREIYELNFYIRDYVRELNISAYVFLSCARLLLAITVVALYVYTIEIYSTLSRGRGLVKSLAIAKFAVLPIFVFDLLVGIRMPLAVGLLGVVPLVFLASKLKDYESSPTDYNDNNNETTVYKI